MRIIDLAYNIRKYCRKPEKAIVDLCHYDHYQFAPLISDKLYIKCLYKVKTGRKLNLNNPKMKSEKLQWLKLYDRNPRYTKMVDKYEGKRYVASIIGEEYIIPTLGVYDSVEEINWDGLPNQFVLKCTHDSGSVVVVKDKGKIDKESICSKIKVCLNKNHFYRGREWPYKSVKPRIIAEMYLGEIPNDYKVLCVNGTVELIEVHTGRFTEDHTEDFYDKTWNKTGISKLAYCKASSKPIAKPDNLEKMISLSEELSFGIPQLRVDWYDVNGKLYWGEFTFFDGSGCTEFDNPEDELWYGNLINLDEVKDKIRGRK